MSSFPMAGRGPKARYYAGVNSLAIFSAQGSNPVQDCKVFGKGVAKVYDKSVKGYVYSITGGLQSRLQLPKDDNKTGLQLLHHFLVLQIFVPEGVHFSVELRVSDTSTTRRKMYFSTSFSEMKSTPLHCRIPISMVIRKKWLSLVLHVADLFNSAFRGAATFRSTDVIILGPVCKLRKIFTMRCRISPTAEYGSKGATGLGGVTCRYPPEEGLDAESGDDCLPQEHLYAAGVDACVQVIDLATVQSVVTTVAAANGTGDAVGSLPENAARENGMNGRKGGGQQGGGKGENGRASTVHVAFGTRMPLPLSTVQINTNLPHDKSPTLVKDRIGRVHFVSDPSAAAADEAKHSNNSKAPPLGITNITLSRGMGVYHMDKETGPLQQQLFLLQRKKSNLRADGSGVDTLNSRLSLLKSSKTLAGRQSHFARMSSDEKEYAQLATSTSTATPSGLGSSTVESGVSTTDLDPSFPNAVAAAEDLQISPMMAAMAQTGEERHSGTSPRLVSSVIQRNDFTPDGGGGSGGDRSGVATGAGTGAGTGTTAEKSSSNQNIRQGSSKSPTSRWIPKRREVTQPLKNHHKRDQRKKEYKHTRYEDSPPGSPPCGWDRCTGGNQSDDLGFHDHFLDGSWMMHSQLSESADAESEKRSEVHEDDDYLTSSVGGDVQQDRFSLNHSLPKIQNRIQRSKWVHHKAPVQNASGYDLDKMTNDIFSSIRAQDIGDSLDFGSEPDVDGHSDPRKGGFIDDDSSPIRETPTKMVTSASDEFSNFNLNDKLLIRQSSDGEKSIISERGLGADQHFFPKFSVDSSKLDRLQVPELDVDHAISPEGSRKSSVRPDDDLDLLYDPTLDCYYDPKTNRYYELK